MADEKPRDRCPVCGYEFDLGVEAEDGKGSITVVVCPSHTPSEAFVISELIGPDDDCVYDI